MYRWLQCHARQVTLSIIQLMMASNGERWFLKVLLALIFSAMIAAEYELAMVHVIYRHGQRAPTPKEIYPNDPYINYTYYPEGYGGLTNEGKMTMYNLGVYLRQRYNEFLGDVYSPDIMRVRTTFMNRSKMSALLVNAGLWPPTRIQQWHEKLLWLPIPTETVDGDTDSLMLSHRCPKLRKELKKVLRSDEVLNLFEPYLELLSNISTHTGLRVESPLHMLFLHHGLISQKNYNLTLPSWVERHLQDGSMYNVTILAYDISSWNTQLKRIYGGPLVQRILEDCISHINGTLTKTRKLNMYSGHESNIGSVLKTLGLWYPHIPDFASTIIFELLRDRETDEYGIQVFYYTGTTASTIPMTLPGCTEICPISNFTALLEDVIPDNVDELCGFI